jgi:hypothetical protein
MESVAYKIPFRSGGIAQFSKDVPVAIPGRDDNASSLLTQVIHIFQGFAQMSRLSVNARVGENANHATEHDIRQTNNCIGAECLLQPDSKLHVIRGIFAFSVYQDINVD